MRFWGCLLVFLLGLNGFAMADIESDESDMIERMNRRFAKEKSKRKMFKLLNKIKNHLKDEGLNKHQKLYDEIENQLKTYK